MHMQLDAAPIRPLSHCTCTLQRPQHNPAVCTSSPASQQPPHTMAKAGKAKVTKAQEAEALKKKQAAAKKQASESEVRSSGGGAVGAGGAWHVCGGAGLVAARHCVGSLGSAARWHLHSRLAVPSL